jgi:hypothetical protein
LDLEGDGVGLFEESLIPLFNDIIPVAGIFPGA